MEADVEASIAKALSSWDRDALSMPSSEADALRAQFVERFPISEWPTYPSSAMHSGRQPRAAPFAGGSSSRPGKSRA